MDWDEDRCAAAGVPEDRREYWSKTELALEMVERAQARGHLTAQWVAGDSAFAQIHRRDAWGLIRKGEKRG